MNNQNILQNLAYLTIIVIGGGFLLQLGSPIILPLIFACLFAAFLNPVTKWLKKWIKYDWLTIILAFLAVIVPVSFIGLLFGIQLVDIAGNLPSIGDTLTQGLKKAVARVNETIYFIDLNPKEFLDNNLESLVQGPLKTVGSGLLSSTAVVANFALVFLYTFFILLYKHSFKNFIIFQFEKRDRKDVRKAISEIKETVTSYVGGMGIVMLILAVIISSGLAIIGIDYPVFWGTLAGLLAIIPYVGTAIGGLLPFLYSLATADGMTQPIIIVVFYVVVQQIEGNFITPKIVGDKVDINPLVAILALLLFSLFWGIAGTILALPLISIVRIIFSHFDELKPLALLMSSEINQDAEKFKQL